MACKNITSYNMRQAAYSNIREQKHLSCRIDHFTKTRDQNISFANNKIKSCNLQNDDFGGKQSTNHRQSKFSINSGNSNDIGLNRYRNLVTPTKSSKLQNGGITQRIEVASTNKQTLSKYSILTKEPHYLSTSRCFSQGCSRTMKKEKDLRQRSLSVPTVRLEDPTLKNCRYLRRPQTAAAGTKS